MNKTESVELNQIIELLFENFSDAFEDIATAKSEMSTTLVNLMKEQGWSLSQLKDWIQSVESEQYKHLSPDTLICADICTNSYVVRKYAAAV